MSQPIRTTDNNRQGIQITDEAKLSDLQRIAAKPIRELGFEEHPNLLVFPKDFDTWGDKIGDEYILELDGNVMRTGNIMGFLGYNDTKVSIYSRFERQGCDYFLHYMLQKVFAVNLFDLKYDSDEESIFDFLIYLFPASLQRALRQGLYKEYQTRHYNDANVRGRIDINRHIRQNIPFAGKITYTTREYATDNHVVQLIRHTIEYIASHPFNGNILESNQQMKEAVNLINSATPSYNRNERQRIIGQNLRPVSHPYFSEYRPLQKLCLQILRHDELKYGSDDDQIYGILFDGAWLWEEYLDTFMRELNFVHPHNRTDNVGKHIFSNPRKCLAQPDFFLDGKIVLDAKYKRHETLFDDWQREDRFQLLAYMHVFNADISGLVVPVPLSQQSLPAEINGRGGLMYLLGMPVDYEANDFSDYCQYMAKKEKEMVKQINHILE